MRNRRSASLVNALPTYEASHPQGCRATSMRTANGMVRPPFSSKYQARAGTSYSATTTLPSRIPPCGPSTETIRLMKWYGGPGSRATLRVPSKGSYMAPNASLGRPQAHASSEA
ncbi:hypothetical protein [Streptomyces sp. NPDC048392]|uniref:hypothetical protein n=1 Tax=Streptomyces sp. NPDC048392 TaxID=3365543 RepID=UPI00372168B7